MSGASVLPGETPFEWSARILARYQPTRASTSTRTEPRPVVEPPPVAARPVPRCGYCGARTGGALACRAHRDLILIDPLYAAEPTEGFRPEAPLDRLQPNGG